MKKFFKKPLNIVSVALAVLGIVGILVMLIVPHGVKYTYKGQIGGAEYKQTIKFKGDKMYVLGDDSEGMNYEIKDGKLIVMGVEYNKINAFKFDVKMGSQTMTYKCTMTYVFFVVACAMAVAGIAGTVYGTLRLKKKKS